MTVDNLGNNPQPEETVDNGKDQRNLSSYPNSNKIATSENKEIFLHSWWKWGENNQ